MPVTVIQAGPCTVVQAKTPARDGYAAVQLGFGAQKAQRVDEGDARPLSRRPARAVSRCCASSALGERRRARRSARTFTVGDVFQAGDVVDVTGISKGRGSAGVIKRHGFSGFPGSHGTHEYFRHGGSIGNRSYPGPRLQGQAHGRAATGNERVTTQNLEVVAVRAEREPAARARRGSRRARRHRRGPRRRREATKP